HAAADGAAERILPAAVRAAASRVLGSRPFFGSGGAGDASGARRSRPRARRAQAGSGLAGGTSRRFGVARARGVAGGTRSGAGTAGPGGSAAGDADRDAILRGNDG